MAPDGAPATSRPEPPPEPRARTARAGGKGHDKAKGGNKNTEGRPGAPQQDRGPMAPGRREAAETARPHRERRRQGAPDDVGADLLAAGAPSAPLLPLDLPVRSGRNGQGGGGGALDPLELLESKSEFAARRGVDPSLVTRWVSQGLPMAGHGRKARVRVAAAVAWLDDRVPYERGRVVQMDPEERSLAKELAELRLKERRLAVAEAERRARAATGDLVERDRLVAALTGVFREIRRELEQAPLQIANDLAETLNCDGVLLRSELAKRITAVQAKLAEGLRKAAG